MSAPTESPDGSTEHRDPPDGPESIVDRLRSVAGAARRPVPALMREAADELERLYGILDADLSVRDLSLKIRDGEVFGEVVSDPTFANKLLAAMMYAFLTSNGQSEMPPNYRSGEVEGLAEIAISPAGEFGRYRCIIEVVKPGGRSSHEIRCDLEAELGRR